MTGPVRLVMFCDFSADPLWLEGASGKGVMMVTLESLPLSTDLITQLREWAARYDVLNDPPFSWGPKSEFDAHHRQGKVLLSALQDELGPAYVVSGRHLSAP